MKKNFVSFSILVCILNQTIPILAPFLLYSYQQFSFRMGHAAEEHYKLTSPGGP